MARYTTASFTTASVSGSGGTLSKDLVVNSSTLDVGRLKITPSIAAGGNVVEIYSHSARGESQLLYRAVFTASEFNEPADNAGAEGKQGWILPYYDTEAASTIYFKFTNNHSAAKTYDVELDYEYLGDTEAGLVGAPEQLTTWAIANGKNILSIVVAGLYNSTIAEAEFRAKRVGVASIDSPQDLRLVTEGGSWVPDGTDNIREEGISAGPEGAQHSFTSISDGRWYFAWRLKNATGWSRWTDGHATPRYVVQYVDTNNLTDTGPPADWEVWLEDGAALNTVIVHASRPKTNGHNLLWWLVQVKNAATGSWLTLDSGTSPSAVKYDGSAAAHTLSADQKTLSKATAGWGTAVVGDLILLDVRGGNYSVNYCQWATVETISGTMLRFTSPKFRPQAMTDLRVKIVTPPWAWTTGGYLGSEANNGMWPSGQDSNRSNPGTGKNWLGGDYYSEEFVSSEIPIPSGVTNPEARVWFENIYSRSDGSLTHSSGKSGGGGVWVAERTFTNFNQTDYWIPVWPPSTWGAMTIAADGKVTMTTQTSLSNHQGGCGMKGRFRLYPDSSGLIQGYVKFLNVTLPVGIATGNFLGLGILVTGHRWDNQTTGVMVASKDGNPSYLVLDAPYNEFRAQPESGFPSLGNNIAYSRSPNYSKFPNNSTVEMRFTVQKRTWSGSQTHVVDPIEIRIGGSGAWTTERNTYAREGWTLHAMGLEIFLGWIGNCRLTGATAKLDTFTLLKGIAEVF